MQLNVSIEVHTVFPPKNVLATKPPDQTSCPSSPDKLIHFVQVHRTLHENPTPMHLGSEQMPTLKWNCFSDEFSQGKADVAEFSLSVSCCLQLCRIGTSCHSGQLATVPADHTGRTFRLFQECLDGHSNDVSSLRRSFSSSCPTGI